MSRRRLVAMALLVAASSLTARAWACGANQTQVYQSKTSVWCVDNGIITQYGTFPAKFYVFGEHVLQLLPTIFNVPQSGVFTFEASASNGGAHTGSECCGLGVTVTGDAFYNNGYNVDGFWGYLLALHESINDWTGMVASGWPTDFWADHISAFPNSMDWQILNTLGSKYNDSALMTASTAQKGRFYPGGDSADPRVPMFDNIFALPKMGYTGYAHISSYVTGDQLNWDDVAVNGANPDQRRTEYVIAYLSLGAGQSLLPMMQATNVGNGKDDGKGDPTYTADEAHVDAIATAHCSIAAAAAQGSDEKADLTALRAGNYGAVAAKGKCGAGCPAECGCKTSTNLCVAPWLGDSVPVSDGGASGGNDLAAGNGNGGSGGSGGGGAGGSGGGGGSGGVGGNGGTGGTHASGCSCQALGSTSGTAGAEWLVLSVFAGLALLRVRRRR